MNPKLNLFSLEVILLNSLKIIFQGQQQVKLNFAEVEKFAQGQAKNINYYKIKAQAHEFKSMEATSLYSEEAQKRM